MSSNLLSESQVARFHDTGFLVCRDFFTAAQHETLCKWVEEIAAWPLEGTPYEHYREVTENGPVLTRTERFLACHEEFEQLLQRGAIAKAISQLFGEPAAVFKEKINYKQAGGAGFVPHQDAAAYHDHGTLHITCLVAIDENTLDNGCLEFSPGKYTSLLADNGYGCIDDQVAADLRWEAATLAAGDIVFFSSYVPHRSGNNRSQQSRRSLYVTYGKSSEGDQRERYYQDRRERMQGTAAANRISTIGHFAGKTIKE